MMSGIKTTITCDWEKTVKSDNT